MLLSIVPISVTITSDPVSPIHIIGSNVTLTCAVELSSAVDVPVTVNTVWTGPAGFISGNIAQPVIQSTTTYSSTAVVGSFGRNQSGEYTCTAQVSLNNTSLLSSTSTSQTVLITVGK